MKIARLLLISLLSASSLLLSPAGQAETVFERFAPPLLPIPVPIIVPRHTEPVREYREHPRHDWRSERDDDWRERREWREERREWRHERWEDRHHHHGW